MALSQGIDKQTDRHVRHPVRDRRVEALLRSELICDVYQWRWLQYGLFRGSVMTHAAYQFKLGSITPTASRRTTQYIEWRKSSYWWSSLMNDVILGTFPDDTAVSVEKRY